MNNLEFAQAIIDAAIEEKSPFIFGVVEGALKYMGMEFTVAIARSGSEEIRLANRTASGPRQQFRSCDEMYPRRLLFRYVRRFPLLLRRKHPHD